MAFFDEFNKRISGMYQSAQKTAEIAKIQHQITQKQAEFDSLYHQIGQLYYSCRQRNVQPDESIAALCDRVTTLAQEIDKLRGKVDEIRDVCRCPVCGSVADRGASFCSKCGAKLELREPAEPEPEKDPVEEKEEAAPEKDVYINWPEARPEAEPAGDEAEHAAEPEPAAEADPFEEEAADGQPEKKEDPEGVEG